MPRRASRTAARLLAAVVAGALLLPAQPASAAPAPEIPAIPAVAAIYPHVKGGDRLLTEDPVEIYGRTCSAERTPVPRAGSMQADYFADDYTPPTARTPAVAVRAVRFPSVKRAELWSSRFHRWVRRCLDEAGEVTRNDAFDVRIGDAAWGRTVVVDGSDEHVAAHLIVARTGRVVITAINQSLNGRLPARPKDVRLARLALRVAD